MSQTIDLNQLEQRAHKECQQDGFAEIALGITLLAWATFVAFRGPFTAALVVALLLFQPRGWESLRARFTYPRVGRVKPHPDRTRYVLPGVLCYIFLVAAAVAIAVAIFGGVRNPSLWWNWLPFFVGMMLVGALAHAHSKSGSARYGVFALLAASAGIVLALLDFASPESRLLAYLLGSGLFFVIAGAVVLVRFLRRYPALPEEVPNDDRQ